MVTFVAALFIDSVASADVNIFVVTDRTSAPTGKCNHHMVMVLQLRWSQVKALGEMNGFHRYMG